MSKLEIFNYKSCVEHNTLAEVYAPIGNAPAALLLALFAQNANYMNPIRFRLNTTKEFCQLHHYH